MSREIRNKILLCIKFYRADDESRKERRPVHKAMRDIWDNVGKGVEEVVRRPRNPTAVYTFVWLVSLTGNWII